MDWNRGNIRHGTQSITKSTIIGFVPVVLFYFDKLAMLLERYAHATDELRGDIIAVVDDMV